MTSPVCSTVCGDLGGAGGVYSATKISNLEPFAAPGLFGANVDFDTVEFDVGPAITPDLANNALVIEQAGIYFITATHTWTGGATDIITIVVDGNDVQLDSAENPAGPDRAGSLSVLVQLSAGARIQLRAASGDGTNTLLATLSTEKRN